MATSTLAAGGWRLEVLPAVALLATVAFGAYIAARSEERQIVIPRVALGLFIFGVLTVLQAVPLPSGLLAVLSPKVEEVRSFVTGVGGGPLSYEPGATLREASKLIIYGLVVWTAAGLGSRTAGRAYLFRTIVVVGLVSAAIAVIHRALGINRLFGLIETVVPSDTMLTTFVNPNHAAGFMVLCGSVAVGLADDAQKDRAGRVGWGAAAAICIAVALILSSKGGLVALIIAALTYAVLRFGDQPYVRWGAVLSAPIALVATAGVVARGALMDPADPWGVQVKLDGMKDALPLVTDHIFFGIGRGSFVSVYPQYKTSPLQLTFAFPENLAAQFLAEWGLVVGVAGLIGVAWVVAVRVRPRDAMTVAAIAGVCAVVAQNLVDFSLELAGMAVPVAVIIGATSTRRGPRSSVTHAGVRAALIGTPAVLLAGLLAGSFALGDLDLDLRSLDRLQGQPASVVEPRADEVWRRHPANPLVSAKVAYLYETSKPPELAKALRAANRALYLAPTYADAYLIAGRLLLRRGFRDQGLLSIRQAWTLGQGRTDLRGHAVSLCGDANDVWQILPRADDALDRPRGQAVALAARLLGNAGRADVAKTLLTRPYDDASASADELAALAAARTRFGLLERTLSAVRRRRALVPDSPELQLQEARVLLRLGRLDEAQARLEDPSPVLTNDGLRLAFKVAVARKDVARADDALDKLRALHAGAFSERLVRMAVRLEVAKGRPQAALEVLNDGLARRPSSVPLRLARARLLLKIGSLDRARTDVRLVLRREPDNADAQALGARLGLTQEPELRPPGGPLGSSKPR